MGSIKWLLSAVYIAAGCPLSGQELRFVQDTASQWFGQVLVEDPGRNQLVQWASGDPDQKEWSEIFQIFTGNGRPSEDKPQVLGSYNFDGSTVRFIPRFPLESNQQYYAVFRGEKITELFFIPRGSGKGVVPEIDKIYPSGLTVPANLLRFYVHFSTGMGRVDPYKFIYIVDENGDTLTDVIYPARPALWDRQGKRLTVLLDPGRIKRGLPAHESWGLAFKPRQQYSLIIKQEITSHQGTPMQGDFIKSFTITDPDHSSPRLDDWKVQAPKAGSNQPLLITFDESLDQAQCNRWIKIIDSLRQPVEGDLQLNNQETVGSFVPAKPWTPGNYKIEVYNQLEDRSGNSLRKPFEVITEDTRRAKDPGWDTLSFTIEH